MSVFHVNNSIESDNMSYSLIRIALLHPTGRALIADWLPAATKVMFLQASVILSTGKGRVSASVHAGISPPPPHREQTPPQEQTPPGSRHPLGTDTPPRSRPPLGSRCQHTVNERPARIPLECILVL